MERAAGRPAIIRAVRTPVSVVVVVTFVGGVAALGCNG